MVDAQLKAAGHEGLNGGQKPVLIQLAAGINENGEELPDINGDQLALKRPMACINYPTPYNARYIINSINDCFNWNGASVFDNPDETRAYLGGGQQWTN